MATARLLHQEGLHHSAYWLPRLADHTNDYDQNQALSDVILLLRFAMRHIRACCLGFAQGTYQEEGENGKKGEGDDIDDKVVRCGLVGDLIGPISAEIGEDTAQDSVVVLINGFNQFIVEKGG